MHDLAKPVRRMLREQAAKAHEAELRAALLPLAGRFDAWRRGELDSFDLSEHIHAFHDGPAREIWSRYQRNVAEFSVAYAIHTGLLDRSTVPAPVLDALARQLTFYQDQDRQAASAEPAEEES